MKYTEKHDRELIDKVIERYESYLIDAISYYNSNCAFCVNWDAIGTCNDQCILLRRFGKECYDYPTFSDIFNHDITPVKVKKRIAVLKRLKHYIKGDWVG